jgi:DNA-binding transcriptional ArsR family regulator
MPRATSKIPVLPEGTPVEMPELPHELEINTRAQYKAFGNAMRERVLDVIAHEPMTAKQLALRLGGTPGAIGYHLQVLERAGLVQIIAKRIYKGIVAKYYTRTARIFKFDGPKAEGALPPGSGVLDTLVRNYMEAIAEGRPATSAFPRRKVSREHALDYARRAQTLLDEFIAEAHDPNGVVIALGLAIFEAPSYQQHSDAELHAHAVIHRRKST